MLDPVKPRSRPQERPVTRDKPEARQGPVTRSAASRSLDNPTFISMDRTNKDAYVEIHQTPPQPPPLPPKNPHRPRAQPVQSRSPKVIPKSDRVLRERPQPLPTPTSSRDLPHNSDEIPTSDGALRENSGTVVKLLYQAWNKK